MEEKIQHEGVICAVTDASVSVRILQESACSACHVRGLCQSADSKEKIVVVDGTVPGLHVGDRVTIEGAVQQSRRAVALAYVLPLLLLLGVLFVATTMWGEVIGASLAMAVVLLYFFALRLMRNRIGRRFRFSIRQE